MRQYLKKVSMKIGRRDYWVFLRAYDTGDTPSVFVEFKHKAKKKVYK